jgi:hypothetical protein
LTLAELALVRNGLSSDLTVESDPMLDTVRRERRTGCGRVGPRENLAGAEQGLQIGERPFGGGFGESPPCPLHRS